MPDSYDARTIADRLDAPYRVEFHESLDSTNDRARELAADGESDVVVVARTQTAGRGREDRAWAGPDGGVWASVLVDPGMPGGDAPLLTLAAGVAVARVAREAGIPAGIKWPNDVMVTLDDDGPVDPTSGSVPASAEDRKLAGILTERTHGRVVVGVGVNVDLSASDLPDGATTVRDLGGPTDRTAFLARLLEEFHDLASDPDDILPAWRDLAVTLGRRVRVTTGEETVVGTAVDVIHPGALVVETDSGRVTVAAGDCEHLRPA